MVSKHDYSLEYFSHLGWIPLSRERFIDGCKYSWENDIHKIKLIEANRVFVQVFDKRTGKMLVTGMYLTLGRAIGFIEALLNVKLKVV